MSELHLPGQSTLQQFAVHPDERQVGGIEIGFN
jgi:hypothetical protein